jgi:hypothetical protein
MNRTSRSGAAAGVLVVLVATLLLLGPAAPARAACGAWTVVPSGNVGALHNELDGVAALSATNAWAVGRFDSAAVHDRTLIEHWNGAKWSVVPSPEAGASHHELVSVAALSARSAWAVGHYFNRHDKTLVEHWNGTKWSIVSSPNVGRNHNELDGVAIVGRGNAWAVGYFFNGTHDRTLIEHWNGHRWSVVPSPNVGTNHNELMRVVALSPSNAYAVGLYFNGTSDRTLVEHWNGVRWRVQPSPNRGTLHNELDGVTAVGPKAVWAVGRSYDGTADRTLIERWNGSRWSIVPSPNVPGTGGVEAHNELDAVGGIPGSGRSVWAVGTAVPAGTYKTLVEHFDGRKWVLSPSADQGTNHNELLGVAAVTPTSVLAVGLFYSGTADRTLAERRC